MKIINLPRYGGKTTRLLYASEFQDIPILCATNKHKQYLCESAKQLGLKIPNPITVLEVTSNKLKESKVEDVLVDEAPMVLEFLLKSLGLNGEVKAITLSEQNIKN